MILLGIDPGSVRTGWGVIRVEGSAVSFVDAGVVEMRPNDPLSVRLAAIFAGLSEVLDRHPVDRVFMESVFHHKSARSALVLGHARGAAMLAVAVRDLPVDELAPAEVKKAVTGRGRAEKLQVQEMVRALLGLRALPPADAADALAVAIAGATRVRWTDLTDKEAGAR